MEQCSRLVLLDVDGTLVALMGDMPAGTAEAVAVLRRGGSAAVFFTGRPLSHVAPLLRGAAFDGGICVMGAFTFLHGETLCAQSGPRLGSAARRGCTGERAGDGLRDRGGRPSGPGGPHAASGRAAPRLRREGTCGIARGGGVLL